MSLLNESEYAKCPEYFRETLHDYIEHRLQPGDFLTAVLSNDLRDVIARADNESLALLKPLVQWIYWEAPSNCWGSKAAVKAWLSNEEVRRHAG